jgi:hypothetical protein
VDISAQFDRRMDALLSYRSQHGAVEDAGAGFSRKSRRSRSPLRRGSFLWHLGAKYGEPFVAKEHASRRRGVDGVRSF